MLEEDKADEINYKDIHYNVEDTDLRRTSRKYLGKGVE